MTGAYSRAELAVNGGRPVRDQLLPYGRHSIEQSDIDAVVEVLRSDWITTGPKVAELEAAFAARVGARHAVVFSSGTAGLHGAAFAAAVEPGDEVVTTPMTFAATSNAFLYQGCLPVFADVESGTLNLDPNAVATKIGPHTKVLAPVDFAGTPSRLDDFLELADRHGLVVIEDACHALGAEYRDRPVGSVAHMTVFSLHPVKHITSGEGGVVVTDDDSFASRLRMFRTHGIDSDPRRRQELGQWSYEMTELGFNYRLPDLNCALAISQLARLDANIARRRQIAATYRERLATLPLDLPEVPADVNPAWHLFPVRIRREELATDRAGVFAALRAEGLGVNVHYIPVHFHPYYRDRFGDLRGQFPIAEDAYERLISLPMFHAMTDADVDDVSEAVTKVLTAYAD